MKRSNNISNGIPNHFSWWPEDTRNKFLEKVQAAGLTFPVPDEWLEAEMEKEWSQHAIGL